MLEDNYRIVKIFYIILFALTALGAVAGAFYYVNQNGGASDIKSYLDNFINGFTNAAFIAGYGKKGVIITLIRIPELVLPVLGMVMFGAVCCASASGKCVRDKGFIIFYLFFLVVALTTFCGGGAAAGWVSTIFMKLLKITVT